MKAGRLEGRTVDCLKQDLQDLQIERIGGGSPVSLPSNGWGPRLQTTP